MGAGAGPVEPPGAGAALTWRSGPALTWISGGRGGAGAGPGMGGAGRPQTSGTRRARPGRRSARGLAGLPRACGPRRACPRRRPRPALGRPGGRAGAEPGPSRDRAAGKTRRSAPAAAGPPCSRTCAPTGPRGQRAGGGRAEPGGPDKGAGVGAAGAPGQVGLRPRGGGPGLRQAGRDRRARVYAAWRGGRWPGRRGPRPGTGWALAAPGQR